MTILSKILWTTKTFETMTSTLSKYKTAPVIIYLAKAELNNLFKLGMPHRVDKSGIGYGISRIDQ